MRIEGRYIKSAFTHRMPSRWQKPHWNKENISCGAKSSSYCEPLPIHMLSDHLEISISGIKDVTKCEVPSTVFLSFWVEGEWSLRIRPVANATSEIRILFRLLTTDYLFQDSIRGPSRNWLRIRHSPNFFILTSQWFQNCTSPSPTELHDYLHARTH